MKVLAEAILSAFYILNKVSHKKLDKTPYKIQKGYAPSLIYLKVWGCIAKFGIPDPQRTKIGPKAVDSIFIGYAQNSAPYRVILIHTKFYENVFPMKSYTS